MTSATDPVPRAPMVVRVSESDDLATHGQPISSHAIKRVEREIGTTRALITFLWVCFVASLILSLALLRLGHLKITDLGGFLQGTVGVVATVISILFLVISIKGTERQIIIASEESRRQFLEAEERGRRDLIEREKRRLDNMLEARNGILGHLGSPEARGAGISDHVSHLLQRSKSYLCCAKSREEISIAADRDLTKVLREDPYITHLLLLFEMAEASESELAPELIDHVWHGLTIEERALATLLIACGIAIPKPSSASLASWRIAVETALPWDKRLLKVEEVLQ